MTTFNVSHASHDCLVLIQRMGATGHGPCFVTTFNIGHETFYVTRFGGGVL